MMAKFVQVSPDLLTQLKKDPERVSELFFDRAEAARGLPQMAEALGRRLGAAPQMFAQSVERMDPRIRERLEQSLKNLGISMEDLRSGKGGDAFANLMTRARGFMAAAQGQGGGSAAPNGKGADISLDKAWHGVHYLLCGDAEPGATLLSQAVLGGTEIGDDDSGYGPARYLTPKQVADLARELGNASLETQARVRFDAKRMNDGGIYPQGWDTSGALDWALDELRHLRDFYLDASAHQFAIVTCIV